MNNIQGRHLGRARGFMDPQRIYDFNVFPASRRPTFETVLLLREQI